MANGILILGLAWWFGGTFFGTMHRLRSAGGSGSRLGSAASILLYGTGAAASLSMIALARTASSLMASAHASFGVFVFGAVLSAILAGCTLGAARA